MQFYAYHGVLEQEQKVGNHYSVDVILDVAVAAACLSDKLEDTINYAEVYEKVEQEMKNPAQLLEHVAWRIMNALHNAYPHISSISVKVTKNHPPFKGRLQGCAVQLQEQYL